METISIIYTHWGMSIERSEVMKRSLASLILTTAHLPVEIIVVDNGGLIADSEWLLSLAELKSIQHYVRNSENMYFGYARNQGVALASGSYLVFSDNDILYKEGWLEKCIELLELHPDRKILVTPLRTDRMHRSDKMWGGEIFDAQKNRYLLNMRAGSNSWVMRRKDFEIVGRFRNHRIAGSKWNDEFVRKGYLMATMEDKPLAEDIGFKHGYNHAQDVEIVRVLANKKRIIIND